MTAIASARPVRVIEIGPGDDTVTFHLPADVPAPGSAGLADLTTRDLRTYRTAPPARRPQVTGENPTYQPRTIGMVGERRRTIGLDPADTGVLPVHVQAAIRPSARDRRRHVGSHRAHRPGLIARLFGLGGAL